MRLSFLPAISLIILLRASAADQVIPVTPQTLNQWAVTGVDRSSLTQNPLLVLPAGAQLSRPFSGSAVVLHLVTRPILSDVAADWPIIEVGPVSLALVGRGSQLKLVLNAGDDKQIDLPWTVAAPTADRGVDIVVGYDPVAGTGLVGSGDQSQYFQAAPSSTPVEVLLTAGDKAVWAQDSMDVMLLTNDQANGGSNSSSQGPVAPGISSEKLKSAVAKLSGKTGDLAGSGSSPDATKAAPASVPVPALEIFTPPAVRHGRADSLRVALNHGKQS